MVARVVVKAVVLKAYKERESIPTLGHSVLNNLKVSWLKSERKGFGKIEKSRWCRGARSLQDEDRFPAGPRALLRWFQSGRNRLGTMKKVCLLSNWSGGVTVKAVMHQAQGREDRLPAGPNAVLSWFQCGRKGLGSCNRFEELNNKYLLTAYFEVIQEHFFWR